MKQASVLLDHEVAELLAGQPELLAVADAVAATQPRRRRSLLPLLVAAALLALLAVAVLPLSDGDGRSGIVSRALAALGPRPVVHAVIEARAPSTDVVDLASGRTRPQTVQIEYWFDGQRGRLRTVIRQGGLITDERLQSRAQAGASRPGRDGDDREPALNPALAAFASGYRQALEQGRAQIVEEGEIDGRRVVWLEIAGNGVRERVAVDAETYAPVLIRPLDVDGRASLSWRVLRAETIARDPADFAPPAPEPATPFRGDVRASNPVSSIEVARLHWPAVWLGETWRGLRLIALERQTLTRGYSPGAPVRSERGEGVRLRYGVDGEQRLVEVLQAPRPEPAYAFAGGQTTFTGDPLPPEGQMELVEFAPGDGVRVLGQLRVGAVYVTIWASSRELSLEAARALRRVSTGEVAQ